MIKSEPEPKTFVYINKAVTNGRKLTVLDGAEDPGPGVIGLQQNAAVDVTG